MEDLKEEAPVTVQEELDFYKNELHRMEAMYGALSEDNVNLRKALQEQEAYFKGLVFNMASHMYGGKE